MNLENVEKRIIINPNLFAHNLKNSRTRKKKDYENDNGENDSDKNMMKPKIKMRNSSNNELSGNKTRYSRKSILRHYRQKQEELNNESGVITSFSENGGNTKLYIDTNPSSSQKEESEFKESINFFKNLEKNVAEGKNVHGGKLDTENQKHTLRKMPYGCLKSGTLPTYRQWRNGIQNDGSTLINQTRKVTMQPPLPSPIMNNYPSNMFGGAVPVTNPVLTSNAVHYNHSVNPINPVTPVTPMTNFYNMNNHHDVPMNYHESKTSFVPPLLTESEKIIQERVKEIHENMRAKEMYKQGGNSEQEQDLLKIKKQKKTIRRKLMTGISKQSIKNNETQGKVSILIPNKTIRKKVDNLKHQLHQTPIQEVKKYLLKHGFIKIGSPAPNDVLRKIYEDLLVLGDVYNRNGENIVYNFKIGNKEDVF